MTSDRIGQVESYVHQAMSSEAAHDFMHVDRVRKWAVQIAKSEGYPALELVETAALLHDVGRAEGHEQQHAERGADIARQFLSETGLYTTWEIEEISTAVRYHNALDDHGQVAEILRDADILDLLGAVGVMRACMSMHFKLEYDANNAKGETWQLSNQDFNARFAAGNGIGKHIVDHINFQVSCCANLRTPFAKRVSADLVNFMKTYLVQLEAEVVASHGDTVRLD